MRKLVIMAMSPNGMDRLLPVVDYASLEIKVERVMTDNGPCYRSRAFARACKRLGLRHIRTRPNTPKTNGKAERFIQTSLREWAYARAYDTSQQRAANALAMNRGHLVFATEQRQTSSEYIPRSEPCAPEPRRRIPSAAYGAGKH
jgi:transposase InsO family protein